MISGGTVVEQGLDMKRILCAVALIVAAIGCGQTVGITGGPPPNPPPLPITPTPLPSATPLTTPTPGTGWCVPVLIRFGSLKHTVIKLCSCISATNMQMVNGRNMLVKEQPILKPSHKL